QRAQPTTAAAHRDPRAASSGPIHATQHTRQAQPGPRKPRSNGPLVAILGVALLGIVAIVVYAIAFSGKGDGTATGGTPGTGPAQSALRASQVPALVNGPARTGAGAAQAALRPLACEHTGSGKAYEVGPGQSLDSLGKVPWETLAAGDTVRIHWRAEPYREKFFLRGKGVKDQPIVVCGVAGPNGELPILDGQNAITRPGLPTPNSGAGEPRGLIHIT